jgi:hypothetical protein
MRTLLLSLIFLSLSALAEDAVLREVRIPYLSQSEIEAESGTMPDGLIFTREGTYELYVASGGAPLRVNPPQAEWSHTATRTVAMNQQTLSFDGRYDLSGNLTYSAWAARETDIIRVHGNSELTHIISITPSDTEVVLELDAGASGVTPTVEYTLDLTADPIVWTEVEDYTLSPATSPDNGLMTATIVPHQGSPLDFAPFYRISVPGSYVAPLVEIRGDASVTGSLLVEEGITADNMTAGSITQTPLSADPADPDDGHSVQWVSDGTGSGDAGDVMLKINVGGTVKTITLIDWSAE